MRRALSCSRALLSREVGASALQEVKECAITCMGLLVARLADHGTVKLASVLPLLLDRMRNEITRITSVTQCEV